MSKHALRKVFTQTLTEAARRDDTLFAVATDSRGSVTLNEFADSLPAQFVECGIAEQDAVGISAGLALGGLRPFVCGPAAFYSLRSAEQVKLDVAYAHTNVKVIGVSGGVSYGALGASHHTTQDIALMRSFPGLEVYIPSDAVQMHALTLHLTQSNSPAYVRVGRGEVEDIYPEGETFTFGKAKQLADGPQGAIIACGEMVYPALQAAGLLAAQGIAVSLYDMHTIKPLDEEAVAAAAATGYVLTVEEHSIYGGLGSAIAEMVAQKYPAKMKILGLPDAAPYTGTSAELFAHEGLTAEGIAGQMQQLMAGGKR